MILRFVETQELLLQHFILGKHLVYNNNNIDCSSSWSGISHFDDTESTCTCKVHYTTMMILLMMETLSFELILCFIKTQV